MVTFLDKCEVCRSLGITCRSERCNIEYAKYLIIMSIIKDIEDKGYGVLIPFTDTLSDMDWKIARRELNILRKRHELEKAFLRYLLVNMKSLNNKEGTTE